MANYADLANKKRELIRKGLEGSIFAAPSSAPLITTLTTTGGALLALPDGYEDVGWSSTDGATWARAVTSSDIQSWGSPEPTRSDITADTKTLQFVGQETKKTTIGLVTGADMSAVTPDPTTGEVSIEDPDIPSPLFYRMLALAVDLTEDGEIYIARFLPAGKVTNYGDQKYANGSDPIGYDVTTTGYKDSAAGYAHKWFWGGPGWLAILDQMGF